MRRFCEALLLVFLCCVGVGFGQQPDGSGNKAIKLDKQLTQRWKVGILLQAPPTAPCFGIYGTVPMPTDWPEQQVRIVEEEITPGSEVRYRILENGAKQMLVVFPQVGAGQTAQALVTLEITRSSILAPDDPAGLVVPTRVPREIAQYLAPSPYIESRHPKIRDLTREIVGEAEGGWEKTEAIYDWVRENVEYKEGELKGALAAMRDGYGDCEELTSLFIALCRASKIPARTVWVPNHCYPEFYLEDAEGNGHWYPCQAAGTRDFGSMPDHRPILQKGDNFRVPEHRSPQRYVAEFLKVQSVRGQGQPQVEFIRQLLSE